MKVTRTSILKGDDMENEASMYRKDLYYINNQVDGKNYYRNEKVVGKLKFYLTRLFHPNKYKKNYMKNVLYEKDCV